MRIIAGIYRGRVLATLRGPAVRPTGERLRESLFDVLGDSIRDEVFVDCYAGSGSIGLEAISRGAARVYFIEESEAAQRLISRNLDTLGFPPNAVLVRASARRGLHRLEEEGVRARFCFVDPPYDSSKERDRTLRWLASSQLMHRDGSIIVQHDRKDPPPESLGASPGASLATSSPWARTRILAQGSNALSFYFYGKSAPHESEPRQSA
jgi:16S rRNA (guanine(966)-N(2))-methyltransferase RsmD